MLPHQLPNIQPLKKPFTLGTALVVRGQNQHTQDESLLLKLS